MIRLFTALAALSFSSAALAGTPYVGLEGGTTTGRSNDVDETVEYSTTPAGAPNPEGLKYDDVFGVQYKRGMDVGVVGGYDFGWFRVEGELAHKRVKLKRNVNDDVTEEFLADLNRELNRPSQAPDPGAPGLPALTIADFQPSGTLKAGSAMVNVLLDVGVIDRLSVYGGLGVGRSFARGFDDRDGALARQRILGVRYAVNDRIELGLKHRNFRSGIIKLDHDPIDYSGNPDLVAIGGTPTVRATDAVVTPNIEGEFRTRSLLVSLIYNFR